MPVTSSEPVWQRGSTNSGQGKASRDLPWASSGNMGGPGGYDKREPVHQKTFQQMMSDARGEYANRSKSGGRASPGFSSKAPRLQAAGSGSAHSQQQQTSPGPGAYSNAVTKSGQKSSYDSGTSGKGSGQGKSVSSSFSRGSAKIASPKNTTPGPGGYNIAYDTVGKGASPYAKRSSSTSTHAMSKQSRELPWNESPGKGGHGNYNKAESQAMSFQEMQSAARKDMYKGRSASPGAAFKSGAPRLQNANAGSPFSQKKNETPGPGAASPDAEKVKRKTHGGSFASGAKRF